jgi:hypothetical protein
MDVISKIDQKALANGVDPKEFNNISGQLSFRKEYFAPDHDGLADPKGTAVIFHQLLSCIKEGIYLCSTDDDWFHIAALAFYERYGEAVDDEKKLKEVIIQIIPDKVASGITMDKMVSGATRAHAKADFVRNSMNKVETQNALAKFMLDKFGRTNSFASDGSVMLIGNSKKRAASVRAAKSTSPDGKAKGKKGGGAGKKK